MNMTFASWNVISLALKWGEDYAAAVPRAELAVIEGCGHLPNLEKPDQFNKAVIEFLDKQIR
jgi:pimeloyl-ACP methyl ester carboxylesterase